MGVVRAVAGLRVARNVHLSPGRCPVPLPGDLTDQFNHQAWRVKRTGRLKPNANLRVVFVKGRNAAANSATSCSSRVSKDLISRLESSFSTSRSENLLPLMREDELILSIVETLRRADSRSGASVPSARPAPLSSSIRAIKLRTPCAASNIAPNYTQSQLGLDPIASK